MLSVCPLSTIDRPFVGRLLPIAARSFLHADLPFPPRGMALPSGGGSGSGGQGGSVGAPPMARARLYFAGQPHRGAARHLQYLAGAV